MLILASCSASSLLTLLTYSCILGRVTVSKVQFDYHTPVRVKSELLNMIWEAFHYLTPAYFCSLIWYLSAPAYWTYFISWMFYVLSLFGFRLANLEHTSFLSALSFLISVNLTFWLQLRHRLFWETFCDTMFPQVCVWKSLICALL